MKELRVSARIPRDLNSLLNEFSGQTGLSRSQIERMALYDFILDTREYRKEVNRLLKGGKLPVVFM